MFGSRAVRRPVIGLAFASLLLPVSASAQMTAQITAQIPGLTEPPVPPIAAIAPAPPMGPGARHRFITVEGLGEVARTPDMATLSAGVVTDAPTAAEALAKNNAAMQQLLALAKELGIEDRDVQTANLSVTPQYPPYNAQGAQGRPQIVGYQVSNQVSLRVRDLARLGQVLDGLVQRGANQLYGVTFTLADPNPAAAEARDAAVADARAKAERLARAAGVTLGPVLSIADGGARLPQPMPMARAVMAEAASVPVATGELTLREQLRVTFELQ